jgi:hypothetical protein
MNLTGFNSQASFSGYVHNIYITLKVKCRVWDERGEENLPSLLHRVQMAFRVQGF